MATSAKSRTDTVPRCFKHHSTWQAHVQYVLNNLRNKLIPLIYLGRFNNLLCICGQSVAASRPDVVSAWDGVSAENLREAVVFVDNYIVQNAGNEIALILGKVMKWLQADQELQDEHCSTSSSAFRLLYLLKKAVEKDFQIMEPKKVVPVQQAKKKRDEQTYEMDLTDYPPEYLGQLIGERGMNIMSFMKRNKCHVKFEKVQGNNGEEILRAYIKKTTDNRDIVLRIAGDLKEFAQSTKEEVESYQHYNGEDFTPEVKAVYEEIDEMNDMETIEEYRDLLRAMPDFSATTTYRDVVSYYRGNNNTRYNAVTRKLGLQEQMRTFNNYLNSVSMETTPVSQTAGQISNLSIQQGAGFSQSGGGPLSVASTSASQVSPSSVKQLNITESQPIKERTSQMSVTASQVQVNKVDYNDITANDPCPTSCLVHDRRWLSTYQYVLTQCYTHIRLPKKLGSRFSRLVCTCRKPRPEARLYFLLEDSMDREFKQCKEKIERWPHECQVIVKPLLSQLEKYDRSEIWHSLFKFVFYFNKMDENQMDVFEEGYKLQGQLNAFVPRKEKSYFYQVEVENDAVSTSSAYVQALNTLSQASSSVPATASVSGAAASGSSSSRGTSPDTGAAGIGLYQKSISSPLSSLSSVDRTFSQSSRTSAQTSESSRKPRVKRLRPEDWSEDCYYHGKKKKSSFQCLVNYLHKNAGLPVKLNIPFSMAVCVCDETVDQAEFYRNDRDLSSDCVTMKIKLDYWRGDSKRSILPYIKLCDQYKETKTISPGFLKLVYHFNKVYKREFSWYEDLHLLIKQQRNLPKQLL